MKITTRRIMGLAALGLALMQCEPITANSDKPLIDPATGQEVVDAGGTQVQKVGNLEQSWQLGGASFTFENGRYYGNSGCNEFNGTYAMLSENSIQIQPMAVTRKMCLDQDVMQQEADFAENFPGIYTIKSTGSTMILQDDERSWVLASSTE